MLDYLLRLQGSSNPNVIRAAPHRRRYAAFAGTGLDAGRRGDADPRPVRQPAAADRPGRSTSPCSIASAQTGIGDFDLNVNAARLTKYSRDTRRRCRTLFDAREAGTINIATPLTDASDLIQVRGKPKWRVTGSLTWTLGQVQVGGFANYHRLGATTPTSSMPTAIPT